ncbi:daptide-type RiPP biosynthesis dehydogenase [Paenarthrobacter sp. S56]|uniref:daptide-type RiPP biosynthesis dehydogenase n=1 Tax=Paenarthrobacter sp. S56 TaxID=3138179 RepID=UPI00321C2797
MIADRTWKTRCVILGGGMTAKYVGSLTRGRVGLVADAALEGHRNRLLGGDLKGVPVMNLTASPVTVRTLRDVVGFAQVHRLDTLVGLGGGSVLDAVKLGALFAADPALAIFVERNARRSGLLVLPPLPHSKRRPRTVLIPTTVGTGAEVSAVACLDTAVGRRLLASAQLAGDVAVLDPGHLATLPQALVLEGLLEAFLRVAGTMAGSTPNAFDGDGHQLLARIVSVGERIRIDDSGCARLAAARLSMETHTGWSLVGRNPYGAKHWYVANELAYLTGARKMTATASVIAQVWEEIVNGNAAWGDSRRLNRLWSEARREAPGLDPDPAKGIAELMSRWGIPQLKGVSHQTIGSAAAAAIRNWGGVLPMLRGLSAFQVQHVLRAAEAPAAEAPAAEAPAAEAPAVEAPGLPAPTAQGRRKEVIT